MIDRMARLALVLAATAGLAASAHAQETVEPRRVRFGFFVSGEERPVVGMVLPDSPVARAGVRAGDVLVRIDGRPATFAGLTDLSRTVAPGDTVRIVLRRDGEEREVVVIPEIRVLDGNETIVRRFGDATVVVVPDSVRSLARRTLEDARRALEKDERLLRHFGADSFVDLFRLRGLADSLARGAEAWSFEWAPGDAFGFAFGWGRPVPGARLVELSPDLAAYFEGADEGLLVVAVEPDSPASRAGLVAGDVIVEADGHRVWNAASLSAAIEGGSTSLEVVRRGTVRRVELRRD